MKQAVERLGGHPMMLREFVQRQPYDQQQFLEKIDRRDPLASKRDKILSDLPQRCTIWEIILLRIISLLREPQDEDFLRGVAQRLNDEEVYVLALEELHRRSLIQMTSASPVAYGSHGLVREYIQHHYTTDVSDYHLVIAHEYRDRANSLVHSPESAYKVTELALGAAYHFAQAGNLDLTDEWYQVYMKWCLDQGRQAYFFGNYEMARDIASRFIESVPDLGPLSEKAVDTSKALVNRAVNQHRLGFDWIKEYGDLKRALELWPKNLWATSFSLMVISRTLKEVQLPTVVEDAIKFFLGYSRQQAVDSGLGSAADGIHLKLLAIWYQSTDDSQVHSLIEDEFKTRTKASLPYIHDEEVLEAYLTALYILRSRVKTEAEGRYYAGFGIQLVIRAVKSIVSSPAIRLGIARLLLGSSNYASSKPVRRFWIEVAFGHALAARVCQDFGVNDISFIATFCLQNEWQAG